MKIQTFREFITEHSSWKEPLTEIEKESFITLMFINDEHLIFERVKEYALYIANISYNEGVSGKDKSEFSQLLYKKL